MDLDLATVIAGLSAIAAAGSAAASFLSWRATKSASDASQKSANVAEDTERYGRWERLLPRLSFTCLSRDGGLRATLTVRIEGPYSLQRVDRVTLTIRDERPGGDWQLTSQPTDNQINAQVWALYRLDPRKPNVDPHGRRVHFPEGALVGDQLVCDLEMTESPAWQKNDDWWWAAYDGEPVRFIVECERAGYEPWLIPGELDVASVPRMAPTRR